jgi:hypothetical protein
MISRLIRSDTPDRRSLELGLNLKEPTLATILPQVHPMRSPKLIALLMGISLLVACAKESRKENPSSNSANSNSAQPTKTQAAAEQIPVQSPPVVKIDGKWDSDYGQVRLTQKGPSVTGTIHYPRGGTGKVDGTFDGGKLSFKWNNSFGQRGTGELELSPDGQTLSGSWYRPNDKVRGDWTLHR